MVTTSSLLRFSSTIAFFASTASSTPIASNPNPSSNGSPAGAENAQRPLYLIAHKVLTTSGVDAAGSDGANALEMDMTAWDEGWWCDHDGTRNPPSWHASTLDQFHHVAQRRQAGQNIQFVWLDIKNPDYCDLDDPKWEVCSIKGLQKMAREILQPAGVSVLYGFSDSSSKAFKYIRDGGLNGKESINFDDSTKVTPGQEIQLLANVNKGQKVASYGDDDLRNGFGNCNEANWYTCTELRLASQSGAWGRVFGWTVTANQADLVESLFTTAAVDGAIYGYGGAIYDSGAAPVANDIRNWIKKHPGTKVADGSESFREALGRVGDWIGGRNGA
ncbi:MAG: hypothetical protein Q9160_006146 [Pyrenula sp. 1 TL-2023]